MSMTFEKVDDILTDQARENMIDMLTLNVDFVKSGVMELAAIARKSESITCFDTIVAINKQLDGILDAYADLGYAYSTLLEKYQEATKETE